MVQPFGITGNMFLLDQNEYIPVEGQANLAGEGDVVRVEDFTFLVPPLIRIQELATGRMAEYEVVSFEGWKNCIQTRK